MCVVQRYDLYRIASDEPGKSRIYRRYDGLQDTESNRGSTKHEILEISFCSREFASSTMWVQKCASGRVSDGKVSIEA